MTHKQKTNLFLWMKCILFWVKILFVGFYHYFNIAMKINRYENITKIEKSSTHDVNHASNFFHLGIELAEFSHTEI